MIYLVTQQILPQSELYEIVSVERSLQLLEPLKIVGLDTETEGFDVYTKRLLLVQLGCYDFQVVIDCTTVDIGLYKEYLESDRLFLLWNAKFDLKFFFHQRIVIRNVYDGYLSEKLMFLGYPPGIHGMGLKDAGERYVGVELDKTVRGKIHYAGLAEEVIVYAANDVKYLEKIREEQLKLLEKQGLLTAIWYEMNFVIVLAYIEYCGVHLDVEKWKKKMENDKKLLDEKQAALDEWVAQNFPDDTRFCKRNLQGDLWSGFDERPRCIINWNSSKQVIVLFELLGFNLLTKDKVTGGMKKSIEAKVIEPQKHLSSIAPVYLEFKAAQKVVSTYGQNFLDQINPVDHRIHTNFNQLMDTGRLSCGGKNKQTGEEYVNLQNLPADAETRACFTAEKGNKWISADYQGQESRLIASIANDAAMIELFNHGCGDVHSLTAKMAYPDIIGNTPVEQIKSKFKHYRQEAKGIEFAINYGGDATTIAGNKGIPIEEAQKIYNDYMRGFKGVKAYQDFCRRDVMQKGFILLNPKTGHKAYIYDYDELMKIKAKFTPDFWEYYRKMKQEAPDCDTVQDVRKFFKRKSASEKQSINYRIQATGALCFKLASIYLYKFLLDNDLLFKVKYCIPVHDEINLECPAEIAEPMANILVQCMEAAGAFFCEKVKLGADVVVDDFWVH